MIPFERETEVPYGQPETVSPLIRRVMCENPGPFTYLGTGTYIVGQGTVAVIDPGPVMDDHLQALLKALDGETVSHILVTHTHSDHSPLSRPLAAKTGATILAARPPAPPVGVAVKTEEGDDGVFFPDVVLEGGEVIEGPGWTIEALFTPGHASNHMAFALREENALFCGDHIMGWSTTIVAPPDGDMDDYLNSLDAVTARDFATLWPTHGPPITKVKPFLRAYRGHRLSREAQVMTRLEAGDTTIAEMVPALYASVDKRLWPAASLSVLAHLIRLVKLGRVTVEGEPGLASVFRPV